MNETTLRQFDNAPSLDRIAPSTTVPLGYDLLDEVGRGGMGVVYRARDLAMDREVAVKILLDKYAPDSGTARRFVDEARITGQLQHPGIPAVYQVGTLADGRPFLAMKLIKGDTLDERLKAGHAVDPLAVFEAVAQAVGYAHAHGVIHRDLKPANVMVGAFGEVQVMDWGLAKVLTSGGVHPRRSDDPEATSAPTEIKSLRESDGSFTQAGSVLGTPAFMAPEQAAGEIDKVDARSDVFGLGAILCVLLTGKPPFEGRDAESVRINAVRGKTEEAFTRLDGCKADPDVVALCKRCLAFEPTDRPATADEVAAAVGGLRCAADERAKRAERDKLTAEVRAAEQVKRRRAVQWAAGVVVAVLLLGVAGTTIGLIREDQARRDAETAERATEVKRAEAETAQAEATAVVKFFEDRILAAARPKGQRGGLGKDVTLRDAIAASVPSLSTGFAGQPLVEARLRLTLGKTYWYLGEPKAAAEQFKLARAIFTDRHGPDHPDTLMSMNWLANSYTDMGGRSADALKLHEETLDARRRVLPQDHLDTLMSMSNLANSYADSDRPLDALKLDEETLAARKRVLLPDHPDTLLSMNNLANSYDALGHHADALKLNEDALAARKRVLLDPDHPDILQSMNSLANSYFNVGRHPDALKLRTETLAVYQRILPLDHKDTLLSMNDLAVSYSALDRHADALKLHEETLAVRKRVYPDLSETLGSMWSVAASLVKLKRGAEAIPIIDECVARSAGKVFDPKMIPTVMALRRQHYQSSNDPAGCRATAEMWEKLNRPDSDSLYGAAYYRAVTAAVQAKTPGADAARLATEDADRAMAWLTKSIAAGYKDRPHMEKDTDLDALRKRPDFQKLLASLPELAPSPRVVR